jgi:hypothetical protein
VVYLSYRSWFSTASLAALTLVAGCSGHSNYEPPIAPEREPPPVRTAEPGSDGTGLLGGPDDGAADSLITYRRADGMLVTAMRPIANPGEEHTSRPARSSHHAATKRSHSRVHTRVAAARNSAPVASYQAAPVAAYRVPPAAPVRPQIVAARPAAAQPYRPPAVVIAAPTPAKAPVAQPQTAAAPIIKAPLTETILPAAAAALPLAIPSDAKLAGMQTQLAPVVAKGLRFEVSPGLITGQPVSAHLTLPANLLESIQHEAPRHGLGVAAKSVQVSATLMGDGYDIRPDGIQTRSLSAGTAPDFIWQVKRGTGASGPLRADVQAELQGARQPLSFAVASVGPDTATNAPDGAGPRTWLGPLDKTGQRTVLGAFLVLAALFIATLISRNNNAQRRRDERRRKFSALAEYNLATASDETLADDRNSSDGRREN